MNTQLYCRTAFLRVACYSIFCRIESALFDPELFSFLDTCNGYKMAVPRIRMTFQIMNLLPEDVTEWILNVLEKESQRGFVYVSCFALTSKHMLALVKSVKSMISSSLTTRVDNHSWRTAAIRWCIPNASRLTDFKRPPRQGLYSQRIEAIGVTWRILCLPIPEPYRAECGVFLDVPDFAPYWDVSFDLQVLGGDGRIVVSKRINRHPFSVQRKLPIDWGHHDLVKNATIDDCSRYDGFLVLKIRLSCATIARTQYPPPSERDALLVRRLHMPLPNTIVWCKGREDHFVLKKASTWSCQIIVDNTDTCVAAPKIEHCKRRLRAGDGIQVDCPHASCPYANSCGVIESISEDEAVIKLLQGSVAKVNRYCCHLVLRPTFVASSLFVLDGRVQVRFFVDAAKRRRLM